MLLKLGPEDVPASARLLQQVIILNGLSGIVVLGSRFDVGVAASSVLLDLALLLGFCWILLRALRQLPRFVQTATALCGVGALFYLLSWPLLLYSVAEASDNARTMASLLMLFLLSWELLVIAHIFRRAIESSMSSAIALSFALFVISVTVSQLLFPDVQ